MLNKFLTVVVSDGFDKPFQGLEYINNGLFNRFCFLSRQRNSKTNFRLSFIKCGNGTLMVFTDYGISLPVTNTLPVVDDLRALFNAYPVRYACPVMS